jgi:hypothetical protein
MRPHHAGQSPEKQWASRSRDKVVVNQLGEDLILGVWCHLAGSKVYRPVAEVEQKRVSVHLVGTHWQI